MNTTTRSIGSSKDTLIQQLMVMDEQIAKMEAQEIKVVGYTIHSSMHKWHDGSYQVYVTYQWETTAPTFVTTINFHDRNEIDTYTITSPRTGQTITVNGWKMDYVRRAAWMRMAQAENYRHYNRDFTAELTAADLRSLYAASQMTKGSVKARED